MKQFKILIPILKYWDGRHETGPEFGWGDFPERSMELAFIIEAKDDREARRKAKKKFKELQMDEFNFNTRAKYNIDNAACLEIKND